MQKSVLSSTACSRVYGRALGRGGRVAAAKLSLTGSLMRPVSDRCPTCQNMVSVVTENGSPEADRWSDLVAGLRLHRVATKIEFVCTLPLSTRRLAGPEPEPGVVISYLNEEGAARGMVVPDRKPPSLVASTPLLVKLWKTLKHAALSPTYSGLLREGRTLVTLLLLVTNEGQARMVRES
ncbi:hypothetical protein P280DRAFT_35142 [Massarina eburnea CBS 473.64]|uniref:Uncharacterized protein n=1 Tax=Massarina eburnea CBS 473.64 TaxID=1395130 RepID=A0A6A6S149_9PLEO|nr:hypothetical protein P280DRAFT_35142 [Massarina eburnea CBS 473.64]